MLQHEQTSEEQTTVAAQMRVPPQELLEAISAVEARRDAEHRHQAETVALGEAIEQLGLQSTPEELLTEIENRRMARAAASTVQKRRPRWMGAGKFLCLAVALNVGLLWSVTAVRNARTIPSATVAPLSPRAPQLLSLASVPENTTVHVDYASLQDLAQGKDPRQVLVDLRPEKLDQNGTSDLDNLWSLVKKDGRLYVRAWMHPEALLRITNGHAAHVMNHTYDPKVTSLDISIERFQNATPCDYYDQDGNTSSTTVGGNTGFVGDDYHIPVGVALGEAH